MPKTLPAPEAKRLGESRGKEKTAGAILQTTGPFFEEGEQAMTYLCPCGESFVQLSDYFGPCPWCGELDYEKEAHCRLCAQSIPESQAEFYLCPDCEKETKGKLGEFLGTLEPEEVAYLDNQLDGNSLTDFEWRKRPGHGGSPPH